MTYAFLCLQNIEKRVGNLNASVVKSVDASSVGIVTVLIYVIISTVLALVVGRLASRFI